MAALTQSSEDAHQNSLAIRTPLALIDITVLGQQLFTVRVASSPVFHGMTNQFTHHRSKFRPPDLSTPGIIFSCIWDLNRSAICSSVYYQRHNAAIRRKLNKITAGGEWQDDGDRSFDFLFLTTTLLPLNRVFGDTDLISGENPVTSESGCL